MGVTETRLLTGGINSDDAAYRLAPDELLNQVNVRVTASITQNGGSAQFIDGNTEVTAITNILNLNNPNAGSFSVAGQAKDETTGKIYYWLVHTKDPAPPDGLHHQIICYDTTTDTASIVLSNSWFGGLLDWTDGQFIDCGVAGNKLFWCDPTPRYLDLSQDVSAYALPLPLSYLSLITEPGAVPLELLEQSDATLTGSMIQFKELQFCYRFTNLAGFYSVLSVDSLTKLPVRQNDLLGFGSTYHNIVTVKLPFAQKIPIDWSSVEFIVRDIESNSFNVINRWDRKNSTDATAVVNHNNGSIKLGFAGYYGVNLYTIGANDIAKQYDNVPLSAKALSLIANRLFLGEITEGYDTNTENDNFINITQNTYTTLAAATLASPVVYMAWSVVTKCYAYIIRFNSKNYVLPKAFNSVGYMYSGFLLNVANDLRFFNMPAKIHVNSLTELVETGDFTGADLYPLSPGFTDPAYTAIVGNIISQALADGTVVDTSDLQLAHATIGPTSTQVVEILADADSTGGGSQNRAFLPNATYKVGLQFYDAALRKSGVRNYSEINIPAYTINTPSLVESLSVQVNNPSSGNSPVPDWAEYFSITLSAQQKSSKTISFIPSCVRVALKNDNNNVIYCGCDVLTTPVTGYTIYGIALSLSPLLSLGYGYAYAKGDYMELIGLASGFIDTPIISGEVLAAQDGYVIIQYDATKITYYTELLISASDIKLTSDSVNHSVYLENSGAQVAYTTYATIFTGTADISLYEVAKFGSCNGGSFGVFFDTNTTATTIYGDHYTQSRGAAIGSATMYAYTPNETQSKFPVTDLGRITPLDRIGQKTIPSGFRWSNTNIPGAQQSGYATFDALDYRIIDETAGAITRLLAATKGVSEGGQLVILCYANMFVAMVGKAQLYGSDQTQAAITSTNEVIGDINPITGGWGCQTPRAAVFYKGLVFFPDVNNRAVIQFAANGATPISRFKATRLFKQLFGRLTTPESIQAVSGCVSPYTNEYMLYVPTPSASSKPHLATTNLENPLDSYYNRNRVWLFDWENNKWRGSWEAGWTSAVQINNDVYSWSGRAWKEFVGEPGIYCGESRRAIIAIPYNKDYPAIKRVMSLQLDGTVPPDETYIVADGMTDKTGVAITADYEYRESDYAAEVLNDRLSNNASTDEQYNNANFSGERLRGKNPVIVMVWYGGNAFYTPSVGLNWELAAGHGKNK